MTTAGLSALGSTTKVLLKIATKPDRESPEYAVWIEQQDFLGFLRAERQREEVVLYAGLVTHCFLYGIAVPSSAVVPPVNVDDLLHWSVRPVFLLEAISRLPGKALRSGRYWIETPLNRSCAPKTLKLGEQLLFIRDFDGYRDDRSLRRTLAKGGSTVEPTLHA